MSSKKLSYKRSRLPNIFNRIDYKIALRNGIGAGLALVVGNLLSEAFGRPNPVISSLWTCLTTILVLQAHLGGTYRASWNRFLGLIVGTLIGGAMTAWVSVDPVTLGVSVSFTIILCSILQIQESFRIATATVAVIMIVWQLNPEVSPWVFSMYRFIDSCFGILIAVGVAHTILPYHARQELRSNIAEILGDLSRLYQYATHISANTDSEQQKKISLELIKKIDDKLHENRQILEDSKAELLTRSARIQDWAILLSQLDELFEQVLSIRLVYKPSTKKLFDEPLEAQFNEVIQKINTTFQNISLVVENDEWITNLPDLSMSLNKLKEELTRFRGTRTTREFGIEDVESFFVFFYSLKTLLGTLRRIEATLEELYRS